MKWLVLAAAVLVTGPVAQTPKPLRFEVASIKPSDGGGRGGIEILPGGGLRMSGVTLYGLVDLAYNVRGDRVSGGPRWAQTEAFAILAKAESDGVDTAPPTGTTTPQAFDQMRERLRNLLAERFQLVVRVDRKETPGYALVIAKGGTKLKPTEKPLPPGTMRSRGEINGRSGTMAMLAAVLGNYLGRPVADQTGLLGNYDYKLEYGEDLGPDGSASTEPGASITTALQEQLGLKLESARVPVESIVIVKAERPGA